jgi:hypothetical protein
MPGFDLSQHRFLVISDGLRALSGVLNFDGFFGHRVGEVGLTH